MSKIIYFPKERGFAIVAWNKFTMSLGKIGFDIGWFEGDAPVLLQINLLEMQENYPKGYSGITVFCVQILKFSIGLSFDWK